MNSINGNAYVSDVNLASQALVQKRMQEICSGVVSAAPIALASKLVRFVIAAACCGQGTMFGMNVVLNYHQGYPWYRVVRS